MMDKMYNRNDLLEEGYIPVEIDKQNEALIDIGAIDKFRVELLVYLEDIPGVELLIDPHRKEVATYRHYLE